MRIYTRQDANGQQNSNSQRQPPPPEAGGPQSDTGPYALPKVEVVEPGTGKPLVVRDQKGKEQKYQVLSREGYTARHEVD